MLAPVSHPGVMAWTKRDAAESADLHRLLSPAAAARDASDGNRSGALAPAPHARVGPPAGGLSPAAGS